MRRVLSVLRKNTPIVILCFFIFYWLSTSIIWSISLQKKDKWFNEFLTDALKKKGLTEDEIKQSPEYLRLNHSNHIEDIAQYFDIPVFLLLVVLAVSQVMKVYFTEISLNKQQRNFLLAISHELKSPLASIKLSVETMKRRQLNQEQVSMLLENTMTDANRLQSLVENVLVASKIEGKDYQLQKEEFDLSDVMNYIVEGVHIKAHCDIKTSIEPGVKLKADHNAVTMIIVNLVENALKYSDNGEPIEVNLHKNGKFVEIEVKDRGIGISDKEKRRVFDKFYRVGDESVRKTKGTGLGLYIIHELARIHSGSVKVTDNQPKGSVFTVRLPLS